MVEELGMGRAATWSYTLQRETITLVPLMPLKLGREPTPHPATNQLLDNWCKT